MPDIYSPERLAEAQRELDKRHRESVELTKRLQEFESKRVWRGGIMGVEDAKALGLTNGR